MRVRDPAGWPWTVRRRWLPWRPRARALPFLAVEWLLLVLLLPLVLPARLLGVRWVVAARGRRPDGVRVRYEAVAPRWASRRMRDTAAAQIEADGEPHALGPGQPVPGRVDEATDRLRQRLRDGDEIRIDCHVQGFGAAKARDGWFRGRITAGPGLLSFDHMRGFETISWVLPGVLPGGDDVRVALAGPDERAAVGDAVVASYVTAAGPFRVAVDPALGPLLADVLAAGTETVPAADASVFVWRRDGGGAVREVARAGCRADAEMLAYTLEARGSRHTFWVAARR